MNGNIPQSPESENLALRRNHRITVGQSLHSKERELSLRVAGPEHTVDLHFETEGIPPAKAVSFGSAFQRETLLWVGL